MKAPKFDGSKCGTIPLPRPTSTWSAAAVAAAATVLRGYNNHGGQCRGPGLVRGYRAAPAAWLGGSSKQLAGCVRRSRFPLPTLRNAGLHDGSFFRPSISTICENHTAAAMAPEKESQSSQEPREQDGGEGPEKRKPAGAEPQKDTEAVVLHHPPRQQQQLLTRQELIDLVPNPSGESIEGVDECLRFFRDPYLRGYASADAPDIALARNQHDVDFPSPEQVTPADEETSRTLWNLQFAIISRLRSREDVDLDHIYETYLQLPEPRIPYIHGRLRHQLLRALGQPEKKNSKSMLRYFAVIADVKNCGFPVTTAEWNATISFASRYVGTTTAVEAEWALKLWRQMEVEAGIKGTDVTFNILFDAASKAGNFTLAEMIYKEMEARGHRPNRYHHVSLIHFFGLKMDTAGLRAAYIEMVNAGEMIDTVALNAVISGLLRSGDEDSAERVYERMKAMASRNGVVIPIRTYSSSRVVTQALDMFAKIGRKYPSLQSHLQESSFLYPDLQTYRILINHHGVKRGDLATVARYIDEMKFFHIPLHGSIFLALFKSFALHGGSHTGAEWSAQRLSSIWYALLSALDDKSSGVEIKVWLVIWVLRAFHRCCSRQSVLDAYQELRDRWDLGEEDRQFLGDFLSGLVRKGW